MGVFSFNCEVCGHPMLGVDCTNGRNDWMSDVVAISSEDEVFFGEYDSYGRCGETDVGDAMWYHSKCWELCGKPYLFVRASEQSNDQGYFFEDADHDFAKPETLEEAKGIRRKNVHSILKY